MANIDDLMAAMNGHKVTDDEGEVQSAEETVESEPAADEAEVEAETADEESIEAEKPADDYEFDTQTDGESEETQPIDDESEQRVPKKRFDKVYGEKKALERELNTLRSQLGDQYEPETYQENRTNVISPSTDKADLLETEMLYERFPQFDPRSSKYSKTLDQMGYEIHVANPGISKLEAARRATKRAAELTKQVDAVKGETVTAKKQVADSGMTSRASRSTGATTPDIDNMSDQEIEQMLRSSGNWK